MSKPDTKVHIVGIGSDGLAGLTARARDLVLGAQLLLGAEAALSLVSEGAAERYRIGNDLGDLLRTVEGSLGKRRMVVLASGDPLFYGVARYLCDRLGKDAFEVLPHVSSMQLAFARVKESWEEAYLANLAAQPLAMVADKIRVATTVGLFTSETDGPPRVARELLARGIDYFRAYVCENLGGPDERVTQGELAEIAAWEFAPLNVMILVRKPNRPDVPREVERFRLFGNDDDVFAQSRPKSGLITQAETRAIALAQLELGPGCVMWDVGAGSGSVAIEAARLCPGGTAYAIEQDAADFELIRANAELLQARNVQAVHGTAPMVFEQLPRPNAIFVGGLGHEVARLLQATYNALQPNGRLVAHVATLESLTGVYAALKGLGEEVQVWLLHLARGMEQLESLRFEAVNPTFLLRLRKRNGKSS